METLEDLSGDGETEACLIEQPRDSGTSTYPARRSWRVAGFAVLAVAPWAALVVLLREPAASGVFGLRATKTLELNDGFRGPASTTRYWDCSYQHCYAHMSPKPSKFHYEKLELGGNVTYFARPELGLFEQWGHLFGTVAVSRSLDVNFRWGSKGCGKCYDLKMQWGNAQYKDLTVMATNFCPECNKGKSSWGINYLDWHFDFAIPGGGLGLSPHCQVQYPWVKSQDWLVTHTWNCRALPKELQASCELGITFLPDYGNVFFKEVPCPWILLDRLGC